MVLLTHLIQTLLTLMRSRALDDGGTVICQIEKNQKWKYLEIYIEQIIEGMNLKSLSCHRSLEFCLQFADLVRRSAARYSLWARTWIGGVWFHSTHGLTCLTQKPLLALAYLIVLSFFFARKIRFKERKKKMVCMHVLFPLEVNKGRGFSLKPSESMWSRSLQWCSGAKQMITGNGWVRKQENVLDDF